MNLFKRNLLQQVLARLGRRLSGWQDVGYVTIVVLSALSAIAFLGEYQAQGEPSKVVEPFPMPAETKLPEGSFTKVM